MSVIMGNGTPGSDNTWTPLMNNTDHGSTLTTTTDGGYQMHICAANKRPSKSAGENMAFRGASAPRRINIAKTCFREQINHVTSAPPIADQVKQVNVCTAKQTAVDEGRKETFHGARAPRRINLQKPIPRKREVGSEIQTSIEPNSQARIPTPYKNRRISRCHRQELLTDLMFNIETNNHIDNTTETSVYPSCKLANFIETECTNTKRRQLKSVVVKVNKSRSIHAGDSSSRHHDHHNNEKRRAREQYYDKHPDREELTKDVLTDFKISFRR